MQLTDGNLYWKKYGKIKKTYPYLTYNTNCDVLVIGGGITGAITAYFLAKEGMNVIVVEKNIIGYGSTSACTALLEYQIDIDLYKLQKLIGDTQANKAYKLCKSAIDDIEEIIDELETDTEFERKNALYFTNKFTKKAGMVKEFETRKSVGFDTDFLDNHELLNINSGILTKDSSAVVNPYKFTQELFMHLSKFENVKIFENTEIVEIKPRLETVECKTNNKFKLIADKVIFAAGFESLKYIKEAPVELYKTFTVVTKPINNLGEFDTNFTARDTADPYHYIRFTEDNRIIFGGEDIKLNEKLTNEKYLESIASNKYKKLCSTMQRMFSNLNEVPVDCSYNGTFANTKDTLPIIDELDSMPNCFCNLAFGANGILYSIIGAKILKNAVKGYYTKDMNMFRINR